MRGVIVLGVILLATIVVAGDEQQFASKKVKSGDDENIAASNLYRGSFFTRQDHTRPQQRELHIFVNIILTFIDRSESRTINKT